MANEKISLYQTAPPTSFIVTFATELEKIDNQKSKGRVRIFYRDLNRNGTYITEEFAEVLIKTLPGTPIVGEYDKDKGDFTQHTGVENTKGYGFVPPELNFAWEKHTDPDGVEREYACCDVILWTGRYAEASEIVGKKQSMELDPDSIAGTWKISNGLPVFTFSKGEFFGLCVLGDDMNPCFEGSSFYTLDSYQKQVIKEIRNEYASNLQMFTTPNIKGGESMAKQTINFRLSHRDIFDKLWNSLNPNYNSEGNWTCDTSVVDVFDNYALTRNYEQDKCYRQYYTKNDTDDTVTLGDAVEVFIVDVTSEEYSALQYIKEVSGSFTEAQSLIQTVTDYRTANPDFTFETAPATEDPKPDGDFTADGEGANGADAGTDAGDGADAGTAAEPTTDAGTTDAGTVEPTAEFTAMQEEIKSLREFKETTEKTQKDALIASYTELLSEETLATFTTEKIAGLTPEQLDKELAYTLVKTTNFALAGEKPQRPLVPTGGSNNQPELVTLLSKYVKE